MSRVFIICLCDKFPTHCDCLAKADGVCVCVCVCVCEKERKLRKNTFTATWIP